MTKEELIQKAKKIKQNLPSGGSRGSLVEVSEFFRVYGGGTKNSFYEKISGLNLNANEAFLTNTLRFLLDGFIRYAENDLLNNISPERKAQLDVVSDFLEQAQILLDKKEIHAAAPAILIGATLEEFLRNWCESEGLKLEEGKQPGINIYATLLREKDFITKQDIKDITAWAGTRNDATHGKWEEVSDRNRIRLMLEGVNLFIRKYSPQEN